MFQLLSRAAIAALVMTLAACASIQPSPPAATYATDKVWSGRMAVKVEGPQAQSFSATFELRGDPSSGQLLLSTPLGSAIGSIDWTPSQATLKSNGDIRRYSSLDELIVQVMGTSVPVNALFDWLEGRDVPIAGWTVDTSDLKENNRLFARREIPAPITELRLVLDRQ